MIRTSLSAILIVAAASAITMVAAIAMAALSTDTTATFIFSGATGLSSLLTAGTAGAMTMLRKQHPPYRGHVPIPA